MLQSWDGLDVEDVEAAAAAGVDDQVCVLIVFFTPRRIAGAVIARRPWRYYDGELSRQRHHVAERSDPEARFWTRQIRVGIMRMRADIGGPAVVALGAVDDLQSERRRLRAQIGNTLVGGEPRIEGFADEADQRADPQRQQRGHLFDHAEPGGDILRIDRGRAHALVEQERRDADDDMGFLERSGRAVHRSQKRQRLAGVVGDIGRGTHRSADQLRGESRIDLIERAALAGEDQFGARGQQRQFYGEQGRHVVMDAIGDREQSSERHQPHRSRQRQRARDPSRGRRLHAPERW